MIERYSRPEIKKIWDEKNKYQIWLDIEIAAAQAMERLKIIPRGVSSKIRKIWDEKNKYQIWLILK